MACRFRGHKLVASVTTETTAGLVCSRCLFSCSVQVRPTVALASLQAPAATPHAVNPVDSALLLVGAMLQGEPQVADAVHEAASDALVAVHLARWLCEAFGEDPQQRLDGMAALSLREQMRQLG